MGMLVNGEWQKEDRPANADGEVVTTNLQFRHWITPDGSAGPTGEGGFKAETGRYHLYVSYACPFASRALMMRSLKGLQDIISLSVVNPVMYDQGWSFEDGDGVIPDPVINANYLREIYTFSDPNFTGKVSVPVLFDKKTKQIVNNESSDIIRMLNSAFDYAGANNNNFVPKESLPEIEAWNNIIGPEINNAVYKIGLAQEQDFYNKEVTHLFDRLNEIEERLSTSRFLVGEQPTESDWLLFATLIRFDIVYFGLFKCNIRRIMDYKNLWRYTRELYNWPGIKETVNISHIKKHYYISLTSLNPSGIVPKGPEIDLNMDEMK
ncbi:glutathione-dependent reductase [Tetragenococcus halophilus subsp. flandriensis]|uniref:glutathione S-transferase family protein n=1 Tax=Tetragenococcus halophilus TaxID=51669 RepID=UPI0023E97241|nr:glutathione S-transferase family protein [Tetragenococcus halophilus]GMA08469.1 glutathione-dependent reductase [Tetragenococcus halophilus subsp. flandriensis]